VKNGREPAERAIAD